MHSSSILLGLGLTTLVSAGGYYPRAANTSTNASCVGTGAMHMIVARASTEAPGEGIIGSVATMVKAALPGSDSEAVVYPATLTQYQSSEASGVAAMTKLILDYAAKCPSSKIAVLGYSQGAQVAADVMCGTSETGFNISSSSPLSAAVSNNVVAMVLMGDPSHVPTETFNAGTSKKNGLFPRQNTAACPTDRTVSYCDDMDEFCDSGSSLQVHLSYVTTYGTAAAKFITDQVSGPSNSSTSTTTSTSNSASTSTSISSSTNETAKTAAAASKEDLTRASTNDGVKVSARWGILFALLGLGFMM
ncbi:carbohydrate esterase family 5 protein [Sclerotinia borealis F-4128]|uniref:Carbohydrate esterase family 5 protein n=1 Tax=Sclerotinia borealis (strain F-4128) TaxID=1432307 RepID=W9CSL9_SCLBF|nr:carbohydrate esterase family 5 protein [Sclerotinia borealis F-4128]